MFIILIESARRTACSRMLVFGQCSVQRLIRAAHRIITGGIMSNFLFVAGTSINFAVLTGEYVTVNTTDVFQKN